MLLTTASKKFCCRRGSGVRRCGCNIQNLCVSGCAKSRARVWIGYGISWLALAHVESLPRCSQIQASEMSENECASLDLLDQGDSPLCAEQAAREGGHLWGSFCR